MTKKMQEKVAAKQATAIKSKATVNVSDVSPVLSQINLQPVSQEEAKAQLCHPEPKKPKSGYFYFSMERQPDLLK